MYTVVVKNNIMIAHSLPDPFFGPAQNLHGLTLEVEAHFSRAELNEKNVVIDIGYASQLLTQVLDRFNYKNLDELPEFEGQLTTVEFFAKHLHSLITPSLENDTKLKIVLHESSDAFAAYEK